MCIIEKDSIVLTAGIGDFISIDSFLTEEDRTRIKTIFWATKNAKNIQSLIREVKDFFPNLTNQIVAWDEFDLFHAFGKASWLNKLTEPVDGYNEAQDLSISEVFPKIISEQIPFRGTCLLKKMVALIKKFNLPSNYVCIAPSTNNTHELRDFSELEMIHIIKWLRETGQTGVVIGWPHIPMPEIPDLINLTGKTSITESLEIVKRSSGYIGIDSWMSVIATQCLPEDKIVIKANNVHLFIYKQIYYAPHTNFNFISREINMMNIDPLISTYPYKSLDRDSMRWCYLNDVLYNPNIIEKTNNNSFELYKKLDRSKLNNKLNLYRSNLVSKYCGSGPVLDVGIGSGLFAKTHPATVYGYDVSLEAKKWLQKLVESGGIEPPNQFFPVGFRN